MSDEERLTPAERKLESALRSLRPEPAQIDVAAVALAARGRSKRTRKRLWQTAAAAVVMAIAGGTLLFQAPPKQAQNGVGRQTAEIETGLVIATKPSVPAQTWAVYRQELAKSPAELEALLDRQAISLSALGGQRRSLGMLTVWDPQLHSLIGEK